MSPLTPLPLEGIKELLASAYTSKRRSFQEDRLPVGEVGAQGRGESFLEKDDVFLQYHVLSLQDPPPLSLLSPLSSLLSPLSSLLSPLSSLLPSLSLCGLQVSMLEPGTPRKGSFDAGNVEELVQRLQREENVYIQADILNHLHSTWSVGTLSRGST